MPSALVQPFLAPASWEIDWANPITQGLKHCIASNIEWVTGSVVKQANSGYPNIHHPGHHNDGGGASARVGYDGAVSSNGPITVGYRNDATNTGRSAYLDQPAVFDKLAEVTHDSTFLITGWKGAAAQFSYEWNVQHAATYVYPFVTGFGYSNSNNNARWIFPITGGQNSLYVSDAWYMGYGNSSGYNLNDPYTSRGLYVVTRQGNEVDFWRDHTLYTHKTTVSGGVLPGTNPYTWNHYASQTVNLQGQLAGNTIGASGVVGAVMMWNRKLEPAEIRTLADNWGVVFKPRVNPIHILTTYSAATTVARTTSAPELGFLPAAAPSTTLTISRQTSAPLLTILGTTPSTTIAGTVSRTTEAPLLGFVISDPSRAVTIDRTTTAPELQTLAGTVSSSVGIAVTTEAPFIGLYSPTGTSIGRTMELTAPSLSFTAPNLANPLLEGTALGLPQVPSIPTIPTLGR